MRALTLFAGRFLISEHIGTDRGNHSRKRTAGHAPATLSHDESLETCYYRPPIDARAKLTAYATRGPVSPRSTQAERESATPADPGENESQKVGLFLNWLITSFIEEARERGKPGG